MSDWDSDMPRQRQNLQDAAAKRIRSKGEADPGLQLLNKDIFLWLGLALAGGLAVIVGVYFGLPWIVAVSDRAISPAQRFTAAFASATALGALFALVVSVRKQNLTEHIASREITAAFTERFRSAAEQLGGTSPAERLAGVYAMAALADEYPSRRQQCVDVLCGYLRLPFDPTTDHLADRSTTTTHVFHDGRTHTTQQTSASRPFDQQVRETIVSVIRQHTQREAPTSWSHLNFNLQGAYLITLNLSNSMFSGNTSFSGATFSGSTLFSGATFSGSTLFSGATFLDGGTLFDGARFSGRSVSFSWARFLGGNTSFDGATFLGERTSFSWARFSGRRTSFSWARFSGGRVSFSGARFSARSVSFSWATFSGEGTAFDGATFWGEGTAVFDGTTFSGKRVSFSRVRFLGKKTSFSRARFSGVGATFDRAVFEDGARVSLNDLVLEDGAWITRDGEPFYGWPPTDSTKDEG